MRSKCQISLIVLCLTFGFASVFAAPPEIDPAKDLPRFPAVEPKDAVQTFKLKPGFHLELVAAEPLVTDPVALCFDEDGRLFVVQMTDYSERRDEKLGSIKLLEDTDGDGKFDKAETFVSGLPWPTGIFPWDGGVFVISTPDLIYFKDTNGDNKADMRRVIYTGFGNTRDRLNVQGLANSLIWGLDNRIHGLAAPNGGIITNLVRTSDKPLDCGNRNFSFNPRNFQMFPENGGGQYGMSFNTRGHKFTCSNSEHLMAFMYEARYADRNPYYAMPKALINIAVDGGAAEVFRISPEEPWRVIRTKWRVSGVVKGIVEGGGRASGYFTGSTGATIYRGNAFPPEYLDNAFSGDAGGNLMHRKLVLPEGVGYKAQRPDDEQKVEFLASSDTWFRPTQFHNAPDGCFYITDMYREVIEHPWSLPEPLKKHIDLNSGNDRGRVYRIVPDGFQQAKLPKLSKVKTSELVSTLEHPNGWHRETAARLLYLRQDKSAVSALAKQAEKSSSPLGRMHALYALDGLNSLTESSLVKALVDADERVREHAIKLSEKTLAKGVPSAALWAKLRALANDPAPFVVYQLAFTLGEIRHAERNQILAECLGRYPQNSWMQAAVLSSLTEGAGEMFGLVSDNAKFVADKNGQQFLAKLAGLIGAKNTPADVNQVLNFVGANAEPTVSFALLRALGEGLQSARSSLAKVAQPEALKAVLAKANQVALQESGPIALRTQAVQLLGSATFAGAGESLLSLLALHHPQEIQLAAISAFGKFNDPQVAAELIKRWSSLTPRLRDEALAILLARPERAIALLEAVRAGAVRRTDLSTTQLKFLRAHRDSTVRSRALATLGEEAPPSQKQAIVDAFMPATSMSGDVARGKVIYQERCLSCHRLGGEGFLLGPDLVTVQNTGKEKLLLSIIDPNREVSPQFQAYEVETKDDESYIGLVANETATSVTIRQAYGKEDTILRTNIRKMQSQQQTLMPEGLEGGLKLQDVADLLEYVSTAQ